MIILLLIYSHIGAVILGGSIVGVIESAEGWISGICAGLFIFLLWPLALWLAYQKKVKS